MKLNKERAKMWITLNTIIAMLGIFILVIEILFGSIEIEVKKTISFGEFLIFPFILCIFASISAIFLSGGHNEKESN